MSTVRGRKLSDSHRAAIAVATKKALANPEVRHRMSEAHLGNQNLLGFRHSEETKRSMSAQRRATSCGYEGAHSRHERRLPKVCARCGISTGPLHCHLRFDVPEAHILVETGPRNTGLRYSLDENDYERLCASCHHRVHDDRRSHS